MFEVGGVEHGGIRGAFNAGLRVDRGGSMSGLWGWDVLWLRNLGDFVSIELGFCFHRVG